MTTRHDDDPPIPQEPYHDDNEQERPNLSDQEDQVAAENTTDTRGRNQPIYLPTDQDENDQGWRFRHTPAGQTRLSHYLTKLTDHLTGWQLPQKVQRHKRLTICLSSVAVLLVSFILFCAVFFSPATYPDPVFPDKVLPVNGTARFLTLNIFMRPPLIRNNWSDFKDDRLAYIERYILPQYDVVCFQESFAFASRRKDRLIASARQMGYNHHVESPRKYPWNIGVDGGLLILSRFPIHQPSVVEYPRGQHSDWLSIKGALHALLQLNPESKVHLYTTHTQASYDLNNVVNPDDTATRLSQFSLLHNFIYDTAKDDDAPIMVVGDLNVDAAIHGKDIPVTRPSKESSAEYTQMVQVINGQGVKQSNGVLFEHPWKLNDLVDVPYTKYQFHPVTFGDYKVDDKGELVPADIVLTNWDVLMTVQSIDRIFWSDRASHVAQLTDPTVEKFWVDENDEMSKEERDQTRFTQISDHYGMSCNIKLLSAP